MWLLHFLGRQASLPSYNRALVERSGVARALVEVRYFYRYHRHLCHHHHHHHHHHHNHLFFKVMQKVCVKFM